MKIVTWEGEDRTIPGYGEAEKGKKITLPNDMIESFKKQGLIKSSKSKSIDIKGES